MNTENELNLACLNSTMNRLKSTFTQNVLLEPRILLRAAGNKIVGCAIDHNQQKLTTKVKSANATEGSIMVNFTICNVLAEELLRLNPDRVYCPEIKLSEPNKELERLAKEKFRIVPELHQQSDLKVDEADKEVLDLNDPEICEKTLVAPRSKIIDMLLAWVIGQENLEEEATVIFNDRKMVFSSCDTNAFPAGFTSEMVVYGRWVEPTKQLIRWSATGGTHFIVHKKNLSADYISSCKNFGLVLYMI